MIYYILLYVVSCVISFVAMTSYNIRRDGGVTGYEMLASVFASLVPTVAIILLLLDSFEEILSKVYFTKET